NVEQLANILLIPFSNPRKGSLESGEINEKLPLGGEWRRKKESFGKMEGGVLTQSSCGA
ncbi:Hypothetical predicted protein, partial [Prunus dulcis]